MGNKPNPADRSGDLNKRLKALDEKLDRQEKNRKVDEVDTSANAGYGNAMKMSSEFISAILVGAGIGYFIDYFAGTSPWAMIIFMLLGFVAGIRNILRSAGETSDPYKSGLSKTGGPLSKGHDDLYDDD